MKEYAIEEKIFLDSKGTAEFLGKAVGTIRNMTHMKKCPPFIRKNGKLFFEKEALQKFKEEKEIIEINSHEET